MLRDVVLFAVNFSRSLEYSRRSICDWDEEQVDVDSKNGY